MFFLILFFKRKTSDLGNLQEIEDVNPENLGALAVEAFERRIRTLDRENKDLHRKLQGG